MKLLSGSMNPVPPLGLAYVAAALRNAGHEIHVIDAIGEAPLQTNPFNKEKGIVTNGLSYRQILDKVEQGTELIGFSMMFTENWLSDRALLEYLGERLPDVTFFAGGEHISAYPELWLEQSPHLKICVTGEGEATAIELVNALEKNQCLDNIDGIVFRSGTGSIVTNPKNKRIRELEGINRPAWDLFPINKYNEHNLKWGVNRGNSLPLLATRGCPYMCTFCSSPQMWGTKYSMRSPQDVADEIEFFQNKYAISNFDFYDLTAIIKKEWIIEFADEIKKRSLSFTWQIPGGTRSEAINAKVAKKLYESGCRNITYAPESGSPEVLHLIKKKISIDKMLQSMRYSYKENMNIKINIILGFPDETHKHLWKTIWFLIRCSWVGAHDSVPAIFSPYPGSKLFERLYNEGKINLENDDYFWGILDSNDFLGGKFYNNHLGKNTLRVYFFLYLFFFFGSNYIFRPWRIIKNISNILKGRQESRGEAAIIEIMKRRKFVEVEEHAANELNAA
jgi:anaerobic magnesium-protoporphyrin IX monomethyl ester cyclase